MLHLDNCVAATIASEIARLLLNEKAIASQRAREAMININGFQREFIPLIVSAIEKG